METELRCAQLRKDLVKYLDKAGELRQIEEAALAHKTHMADSSLQPDQLPPLRLALTLDYTLLAETAGDFARLLLSEPFLGKQVLSEVVRTCCLILAEMEEIYISLVPKLTSFPVLSYSSKENNLKNTGLFTKYGILYELRPLEKYTLAALYKCDCGQLAEGGSRCEQCGGRLALLPRTRLLGDVVQGLLLDPVSLQPSPHSRRTQADIILFQDELCAGLTLGARYTVAVTCCGGRLQAWGVTPVLPQLYLGPVGLLPMSPLPRPISHLLQTVREESPSSPWAMVNALAAHLASDLYPLSAFLHLKTAILLSLASIRSSCPVSVLALGDCEVLLSEAAGCSPVALSSPAASCLLLASHGVCFLPGHVTLSHVTTAIESELVTLKAESGGQQRTYPMRAAVWVSWLCDHRSGQDLRRLRTLIEIFGMPFLEEIDVNDEDISNHFLKNALDPSRHTSPITKADLSRLVDTVSRLQVSMSPAASALIRNYFVASRRERPDCLPLRAIKLLTGLSESHARLSLRDTVTFEDAVAAIFLYEESMAVIFGPSMFSEQPKRAIKSNDIMTITRQMDDILVRFSLWLTTYTKFQNGDDTDITGSDRSF